MNLPVAIGATYDGEQVVIVTADDWARHVVPALEGGNETRST